MLTTAVAAFALAACTTPRDDFLEAGATQLSDAEVIDLIKGNTLKGDDFLVYYSESGDKIVKTGNDNLVFRTWRVNDSGAFCETLVASGREACSPQHLVLNDVHKAFRPNGQALDYEVLGGNQVGTERLATDQIAAAFQNVKEDYVGKDSPDVTATAVWGTDSSFAASWQSSNDSGEVSGTWYVENNMRCIQFDEAPGSYPNPECLSLYTSSAPNTYTSVWPDGRVHGVHTLSPLN